MAKKWIINDGRLILGYVEYHSELGGKGIDHKKTIGGGVFEWDRQKDIVYFWGASTDYGMIENKDVFEKSVANSHIPSSFKKSKFMFSNFIGKIESFEDKMEYFEEIKKNG